MAVVKGMVADSLHWGCLVLPTLPLSRLDKILSPGLKPTVVLAVRMLTAEMMLPVY
ncbi:MAG: hypothetical protein PVSMB2_10950 [Ktedonobacteraceae bacterium]